MNPINIFILSRLQNNQIFSKYEQTLAQKSEFKETKSYEQQSLRSFVDDLLLCGIDISDLDGFYFGFTINQISKEFDLLKIFDDCSFILNIELKSTPIPEEKIKKQLIKNRYYLRHIADNIASYSYISSENKLYILDDENNLKICKLETVISDLKIFKKFFNKNLNSLFTVSDYLVSPLNSSEKFINTQYFLTNQQEEFKNSILKSISQKCTNKFIGITGYAGTGKTLLLYDIARECSSNGLVCIIHCGILSEGHLYLQDKLAGIHIVPIKEVKTDTDFSRYKYIFVDESQRIRPHQFDVIVNYARNNNKYCFFSYDSNQVLSKYETQCDIPQKISDLKPKNYNLSNKIRTNKELAEFIRTFFNRNSVNNNYHYDNVKVLWANNSQEAELMIENYQKQNYTFINYTSSLFKSTDFDCYSHEYNTHEVLGQEFDNVLILLNDKFYYNDKKELTSKGHPNPDYLYFKMLFQAITRTREQLCIIVIGNEKLFMEILSIKVTMEMEIFNS